MCADDPLMGADDALASRDIKQGDARLGPVKEGVLKDPQSAAAVGLAIQVHRLHELFTGKPVCPTEDGCIHATCHALRQWYDATVPGWRGDLPAEFLNDIAQAQQESDAGRGEPYQWGVVPNDEAEPGAK